MKLLVVHQNFPGQFAHLVPTWARRTDWDVRGIGRDTAPGLPGFDRLIRYRTRPSRAGQHPYLRSIENATLHGQAVARELSHLSRQGFRPDVILAHPGWGETLFAKEIAPNARLVHLCEWYYGAPGSDVGFDPEFPQSVDDRARLRAWNMLHATNAAHADLAISPTEWQRSRHPDALRSRIVVQHEGLPVSSLGPDPSAHLRLPSGVVVRAGDPVVTYVARNLEPYRGFHIFMRALQRLQQEHPTAQALIVGGDGTSYGPPPRDAKSWRERLLREVQLDPQRTHFLGKLPYRHYLQVLRVSAAHVYLTYPFVLSWSLIEALACGAPVIGSDTGPVREVIKDGVNGRLVPFFEPDTLAARLLESLTRPQELAPLRRAAIETARRYCANTCRLAYERLLESSFQGSEGRDLPTEPRAPATCS